MDLTAGGPRPGTPVDLTPAGHTPGRHRAPPAAVPGRRGGRGGGGGGRDRGVRRQGCSPGTTTRDKALPDRETGAPSRESSCRTRPLASPIRRPPRRRVGFGDRVRPRRSVHAVGGIASSRMAAPARSAPRIRRRRRPATASASGRSPRRRSAQRLGHAAARGQRAGGRGAPAAAGRGAGCTWARWTGSTASPSRTRCAPSSTTGTSRATPRGVYGPKTRRGPGGGDAGPVTRLAPTGGAARQAFVS